MNVMTQYMRGMAALFGATAEKMLVAADAIERDSLSADEKRSILADLIRCLAGLIKADRLIFGNTTAREAWLMVGRAEKWTLPDLDRVSDWVMRFPLDGVVSDKWLVEQVKEDCDENCDRITTLLWWICHLRRILDPSEQHIESVLGAHNVDTRTYDSDLVICAIGARSNGDIDQSIVVPLESRVREEIGPVATARQILSLFHIPEQLGVYPPPSGGSVLTQEETS